LSDAAHLQTNKIQEPQPSPISPNTSIHGINGMESFDFEHHDETTEETWESFKHACYLDDISDTFAFPHSKVALAKPSQYLTKDDLKPVQCIQSFLYLVYRKQSSMDPEVSSFFKVCSIMYYYYIIHYYVFVLLFLKMQQIGYRTYDDNKAASTLQKVVLNNINRYKTFYGPSIKHF
jgi:hypothetical protein